MSGGPIVYSIGRGVRDNKPVQRSAPTFDAFVADLDRHRAPSKAAAGYICAGLNGTGRRCAEGVLPRCWVALDFDRVAPDVLPRLLDRLAQHSGATWPTHSSTPEAPRLRAILELDREATRDEAIAVGAAVVTELAAEFGDAIEVDASTLRGEQPIFLPPAGAKITRHRGEPLRVESWLDGATAPEAAQDAPERPQGGDSSSDDRIPQGTRNASLTSIAGALRSRGFSAKEIASLLLQANKDRCDPPLDRAEVLRIARSIGNKPTSGDPNPLGGFRIELDADTGGEAPKADAWPDPADPFAPQPVPAFPLDVLPESLRDYAADLAAASGFDVGAYAFATIICASAIVDQRKRIAFGPMAQPAFLWGALVNASGGGKSPVFSGATFAIHERNGQMIRDSQERARAAKFAAAGRKKGDPEVPRPAQRQMVSSDTTPEAMAHLLIDNPEGVLILSDEMTELIGRMDAYGGGKQGGAKDRGTFIRAFNGDAAVINRASRDAPLFVGNFGAGILTAVQPAKLAEMYTKSGSSAADGLFQRFLVWRMAPAGAVDYFHAVHPFRRDLAADLWRRLLAWREDGTIQGAALPAGCLREAQDFHNGMRTIAKRTADPRLAEHVEKFPGLLARLTFTMHALDRAEDGAYAPEVAPETFARALRLAAVLYRHSEATYAELSRQGRHGAGHLVRSAAEAILAHGWQQFQRGDLTRQASGWQGAEEQAAAAALDLLIELDWLRDVTKAPRLGQRGRPSLGRFAVNPAVHRTFKPQAEAIRRARAERAEAIRQAVAERVNLLD